MEWSAPALRAPTFLNEWQRLTENGKIGEKRHCRKFVGMSWGFRFEMLSHGNLETEEISVLENNNRMKTSMTFHRMGRFHESVWLKSTGYGISREPQLMKESSAHGWKLTFAERNTPSSNHSLFTALSSHHCNARTKQCHVVIVFFHFSLSA